MQQAGDPPPLTLLGQRQLPRQTAKLAGAFLDSRFQFIPRALQFILCMTLLGDVRRSDMADIFIRKSHSGDVHKKRFAFAAVHADLTQWRTTHLGNHVKKFMKHRPIGLSHMIGKMAPDRLLAAEPKHIRAGQIRGSNAAINANRQTPDRRIIVELLEVLQILLQPIDFRLRLDAYITDGRRFANSRLLGFFRVHDDSSFGGFGSRSSRPSTRTPRG